MTRRVSAKEARDNFSELLGQVHYKQEPVIVEKNGKPFAVLIDPDAFARFQEDAKRRFFAIVDEIHERNKDVDPEQAERDVAEAVAEVRRERRAQRERQAI